jgi:hypothetical protein
MRAIASADSPPSGSMGEIRLLGLVTPIAGTIQSAHFGHQS